MKTTTLFFIAILFFSSNYAQNNKSIDSSYIEYFKLTREIPYIHLNKTSFIKGEEIWFQAYILNQKTKKLHKETTNLYCSVYDKNGVYKQSKLLYVKNGIASGSIKIDSTFTNNTYYLKASTNWMRNFTEDESFLQKIHIVGTTKPSEKQTIQHTKKYDIQLLPEGGHLVENTNAVVGLIIKDKKGKGVNIKSGVLLDTKNNFIKNIKTNRFGIGKFNFTYNPNTKYKVKINTYKGEELIKEIPKAKKLGMTLTVINPNTTFVKISLITNEKTLQSNLSKSYYLYIHNTKTLLKSKIVFEENLFGYNFTFPNKKLAKGINIVTVVNENQKPILERIFFNYDKSLISKINSKALKHSKDSITIELNKTDKNIAYLSTTLLPEKTKSYELQNTMFSKFLLKPYIKGHVENSKYYFTNTNRKKLANLDLLLLTQGWSKYNWYGIFNTPPVIKHSFDKGLSLSGTINSGKVKDSTDLIMFSPQSKLLMTAPIVKNKFTFQNFYVNDTSSINFTIRDRKKLKRPYIYTRFQSKPNTENIKVASVLDSITSPQIDLKDFISKRVLLNEIAIKGKSKMAHKPLIFGLSNAYKVADGANSKSQTLFSFLRMRGFRIVGQFPDQYITSGRQTRLTGEVRATVFLDGFRIQGGAFDLVDSSNNTGEISTLSTMTLGEFDEIHTSRSFGGEIHLYTDRTIRKRGTNYFQNIKTPIGFSSEKEYYQPKYYSTSNDIFKQYGAIYWKSKIVLENDRYLLKSPTLGHKNIRIAIEGITSDGGVVYEEKILKLK